MRLHRILFSVPICALNTGRKPDITEYRSVSTQTIPTVGLTSSSAFMIVLMLPGRFRKPSVQKKTQGLSLSCLILSSQEFHKLVCQETMRFLTLGFWSWPGGTILSMRGRSGVRVYSSYRQWMDGQRLYWEQGSYLCPYFMHNGQWDPLLLWSILETPSLCPDLRADSDYKTCAITFSPTFCFLEYASRVGYIWMSVGTICAWFWIWMGRKEKDFHEGSGDTAKEKEWLYACE